MRSFVYMGMKKIILTQEQVENIFEGESFMYLKDLATKPDMGNIYGTEVTTDGSMDGEYSIPTTTDDKSHTMTNDCRGNAKLAGMGGGGVVYEVTKRDWEKNLANEETEHGNARLKIRKFGAKDGEQGKSYTATKMAISRKKAAEKKMMNGTPEEKQKAMATLQKMRSNWSGIDAAEQQYNSAKISDNLSRQSMTGPKIASAPKISGNGKAHSPSQGVFLNETEKE